MYLLFFYDDYQNFFFHLQYLDNFLLIFLNKLEFFFDSSMLKDPVFKKYKDILFVFANSIFFYH